MALLAVQASTAAGLVPTFVAASAGGDTLPAGDHIGLRVKNGSGGSITVTIAGSVPCSQGFTHSTAVTVAAGADTIIEPLPANRYGDSTGTVTVTYSAVTSVTVAAISY
jgi:hypothetical protein